MVGLSWVLLGNNMQLIFGIDIVLRVPWDSGNPTKNEVKAWINHLEESYD